MKAYKEMVVKKKKNKFGHAKRQMRPPPTPTRHIFHTTFKEIKKDPLETLKKMGAFLVKRRSEEFFRNVVEKTSFENVKAHKDTEKYRVYQVK